MLDEKSAKDLLLLAKKRGVESAELYSEISYTASITYQAKVESLCFAMRRGTALTLYQDGVKQQLFDDPRLGATPKSHRLPAPVEQALNAILSTIRSAFASHQESQRPSVTGLICLKHFQVMSDENSPIQQGYEESAELMAKWLDPKGRPREWALARANVVGFQNELQTEEGLVSAVRRSQTPTTFWPTPEGMLPVFWSARSVAKLQMLFLRAFEGDRVLGQSSFLCLDQRLPEAFSLEDRPQTGSVDHEGSPLKRVTLLRDGRPTALACNKDIAEQLEVSPTGHGRRQSFEANPTVGFWHAHLQARKTGNEPLLGSMDKGVCVRDLEVLHFDPVSGQTVLRLTQSHLVHQGQLGEALEPVVLSVSLLEILNSFTDFDPTSLTTGFAVGKRTQRLYTEITAPAALSEAFPLPGSVPSHHYW